MGLVGVCRAARRGQEPPHRHLGPRHVFITYNAEAADSKADDFEGPMPLEKPPDVTLESAVQSYIEKLKGRRQDKAAAWFRRLIDRYCGSLKPSKLGQVQRQHLRALHAKLGEQHGRTRANRVLEVLKATWHHALDVELW